jgi:hypothetical protein
MFCLSSISCLKWTFSLFAIIFPAFGIANVSAQDWADLRATFVYDGEPIEPQPVKVAKDPFCLANGNKIFTENMLVNWTNGGIRYIVLSLDFKDIDELRIHPDLAKVPEEKVRLESVNCVFVPHIVVMRSGQKLELKNRDKMGHLPNFGFFMNPPLGAGMAPGASEDLKIDKEETAPVPVECIIHSWMKAYVIVKDHPYVGVSDEVGRLVIKGLPAGEELRFRVWHENQNRAISEVTINGKTQKWDRGYLTLTLQPGDNDLGTIKLAPKRFK